MESNIEEEEFRAIAIRCLNTVGAKIPGSVSSAWVPGPTEVETLMPTALNSRSCLTVLRDTIKRGEAKIYAQNLRGHRKGRGRHRQAIEANSSLGVFTSNEK